jgi:enoyl-CoA hydratase/carnithine racemase
MSESEAAGDPAIAVTRPVPGVAQVTIDRPHVHNALDTAARAELAARLTEVDTDPEVGCILVTGAGDRAFSAGGDLKEPVHHTPGGLRETVLARGWTDQLERGAPMTTPSIAAIAGHCVGAGLEIALACDIRVASETARFASPEVRWGLIDGYGARRLAAVVGLGRATHMLVTGETLEADQAYEWGLVTKVVPQADLQSVALELAEKTAALPRTALAITRELLRPAAGGAEAISAARLGVLAAINTDKKEEEADDFGQR